jgi:hypothetical protein
MQKSSENIYDKLFDQFKNNIYSDDIIEILKDYEIIIDSKIDEDEFVNISIVNENGISNFNYDIDNNLIIFELNHYINKIINSYNSNVDNINQQFNKDFIRSTLFINGIKIPYINNVLSELNNISKFKVNIGDINFNADILILMLCTQASFAFPFMIMNKIFSNFENNEYILSKAVKYNINKEKDNIYLKLDAIFDLKNIDKNIILKEIKVSTCIDFVKENNSYKFSDYGIIYWDYQDIH